MPIPQALTHLFGSTVLGAGGRLSQPGGMSSSLQLWVKARGARIGAQSQLQPVPSTSCQPAPRAHVAAILSVSVLSNLRATPTGPGPGVWGRKICPARTCLHGGRTVYLQVFLCSPLCVLYRDEKGLGTEGHEWQPVLQPAGSAAFRLVVPLVSPGNSVMAAALRWPHRPVGRT